MIYDESFEEDLPENEIDALSVYFSRITKKFNDEIGTDHEYAPYTLRREYYGILEAFMSALNNEEILNMASSLKKLNALDNNGFSSVFPVVDVEIKKFLVLSRMQKKRLLNSPDVILYLDAPYKEEINKLLNKITNMVNNQNIDQDKKDEIHKKIFALQSEINRDRTTLNALLCNTRTVIDIIKPLGEIFVKPAEKLKLIHIDNKIRIEIGFSKQQKQIPAPLETSDFDDDIPF
jgi:hypothetical protein